MISFALIFQFFSSLVFAWVLSANENFMSYQLTIVLIL